MAGGRTIGFFRCCGHGVGEEPVDLFRRFTGFLATLSSCWPLFTFNAGFFAFENPLYEEDELIDVIQSPEYRRTCWNEKIPLSINRQ